MVIVHGFGEHSGRFYPIADYFAKKNYEVLLVDLRGFGYSGAPRGCATVEKLQNDVLTLLK
jgi:acylglycerol lipase